jgi:hypothetical protein
MGAHMRAHTFHHTKFFRGPFSLPLKVNQTEKK